MEIHKMKNGAEGSIISHTGSTCACAPVRTAVFDGKNSGRFGTVYYIHN